MKVCLDLSSLLSQTMSIATSQTLFSNLSSGFTVVVL